MELRRPLAVVRAVGVSDIASAIAFARQRGLHLAIRGGGHNVAGNGTVDGGIVLDLGGLTGITVDRESRIVRVEAGATLKDIDTATESYGLVVPIGVVSGTDVSAELDMQSRARCRAGAISPGAAARCAR